MSARELADWLGLTDRRVRQLADAGVFSKTRRGVYPLKASVQAYIAWADRPRDRVDLAEAKRRKVQAEAELAELKLRLRRGELLERDRARTDWSRMTLSWKERIRALPAIAVVRIPGITKKSARGLASLVDETLVELADGR